MPLIGGMGQNSIFALRILWTKPNFDLDNSNKMWAKSNQNQKNPIDINHSSEFSL